MQDFLRLVLISILIVSRPLTKARLIRRTYTTSLAFACIAASSLAFSYRLVKIHLDHVAVIQWFHLVKGKPCLRQDYSEHLLI